jgi:hypothetical protein
MDKLCLPYSIQERKNEQYTLIGIIIILMLLLLLVYMVLTPTFIIQKMYS